MATIPAAPTESESGGPLAGLRVVELGQYISAPFAAKVLADMGADVAKVEPPDGDPMRRWQGSDEDYSPQFAAYNRNKTTHVIDLKTSSGVAELYRLTDDADVLIENFRPGVATRLGVGYSDLASRNPRLIYCAISGFGDTGPYATRPAYDTVISAIGGMYSQIMSLDTPAIVGPAFSDLLSGMAAVQAVLAALYARAPDGGGQRIEVPMVGALLDFLTESVSTYLATGENATPDSRARRAQTYACAGSDGLGFIIHMSVPEKFWLGVVDALENAALATDPRFTTRQRRIAGYADLATELNAITRRRPRAYWLERLAAHGVPHAPLLSVAELWDDPQIRAMGLLTSLTTPTGGTAVVPLHSVRFARSGRPRYAAAPSLIAASHADIVEDTHVTG